MNRRQLVTIGVAIVIVGGLLVLGNWPFVVPSPLPAQPGAARIEVRW